MSRENCYVCMGNCRLNISIVLALTGVLDFGLVIRADSIPLVITIKWLIENLNILN